MNNPRTEEGLLRTDACFDRHSLSRKFQYDERETESFSAGERALAHESDYTAELYSKKSQGEYLPRYNNMYLRKQENKRLAAKAEASADFDSLIENR